MTIRRETLILNFWIVLGAVMLWGLDLAGLLASKDKGGSPAALQVDFPEIYRLWKKGGAIFVDARPPAAFQSGHIPGAVNVPLRNVEQGLSALPTNRHARLITYCGSIECPNAYQLMQVLWGLGYRNVQTFPRGVNGWLALGYPLEKGDSRKIGEEVRKRMSE